MKKINSDDKNISLEFSHEEILMIGAVMREICFGTPFSAFQTRVGWTEEQVGDVSKNLRNILNKLDITE